VNRPGADVRDGPSRRRRRVRPIDPTGNHDCLAVADLHPAIRELDDRGIAYRQAVQGADNVQIWITDPTGNTIELQQDPDTRRDGEL